MGVKSYSLLNGLKAGIKRARKARKYTQASFAEAFGVSVETVRNWEQGKNIPEASRLLDMCGFFDCDMDYLFCRIDEKKHDVKFISEYTGLSEENIERLHQYNTSPFAYKHHIESLNEILSCSDFETILKRIGGFKRAVSECETAKTDFHEASAQSVAHIVQEIASNVDQVTVPPIDAGIYEAKFDRAIEKRDAIEYALDTLFRNILQEIRKDAEQTAGNSTQ